MSDCIVNQFCEAIVKLGATRILNPCLQLPFQGIVVLFDKALYLWMPWLAIQYFNPIFF